MVDTLGTEQRTYTKSLGFRPHRQEAYLDRRFRGKYDGLSCVIVAGGPSVADVDLAELLPCKFIGVNVVNYLDDFEPVRERFVAGVMLDDRLLRSNLRRIVRSADYPLFVGNTPGDNDLMLDCLNELGIHRVPSNHTEGLGDTFARFSNGGNSGFAALQLAVIMGFRKIGLLGFDGEVAGNGRHFHSEYTDSNGAQPLAEWCELLDGCAPLFELIGVSVWNLSARSKLRAYPKSDARTWRDHAVPHAAVDAAEVLRESHGGSLQLPFPSRPLEAATEIATCFGGARNVAEPERYRPVPTFVEPLLDGTDDGTSWIRANGAVASGAVEGVVRPAAGRASVSREGVSKLSLISDAPDAVQAWISENRGAGPQGSLGLGEWLESANEADPELHSIVACFAADDVEATVASLADLRGAVRTLTCGVHLQQAGAAQALLRALSRQWQIVRYSAIEDWLGVVLRPAH